MRSNHSQVSSLIRAQKTSETHFSEFSRSKEEEQGVIYGTTIKIQKTIQALQRFLVGFQSIRQYQGEKVTQKIYLQKLSDLQKEIDSSSVFSIQGMHLYEFSPQIYHQFVYYPAQMITCCDMVVKNLFEKYFIEGETDHSSRNAKTLIKNRIMVGLNSFRKEQIIRVRDLDANHINRLITIQGMVVRASEVYPQMKVACLFCAKCRKQHRITLENAKLAFPDRCVRCKTHQGLEIEHNLSQFTDKQYIKIQELHQNVNAGDTPSSLTIIAYDSNVDNFNPGDRVEIVGIFRAVPCKTQRNKNQVQSTFKTYIDLISVRQMQEKRLGCQQLVFSDDQRTLFMKMASSPTILNDLINSLAPSIWGHQNVKKGLLAQLFGGTVKSFQGRGRFRSEINICLCGDPSTAKSQLLQQVHRIAPRGIYTSGKGSSSVGLTANVRKDPQTHEFVLQSGALVLSDKGVCCIDEFDKMDQNTRTIMLEAMQQQTISIAKAGIVCQLNSRAAILAAANPINSKFDTKKSIVQNVNLPPNLLSRFDLLYILLDIPNQQADRRMAKHILQLYTYQPKNTPLFPLRQLTRYITFAKNYVHPTLTQQAAARLGREYLAMRKTGHSSHTITATPRQLQSMIRLGQAFAKMRLSNTVSEEDVEQAANLLQQAMMSSAVDPETGCIDLDLITTGRSTFHKKQVVESAVIIKQVIKANEQSYSKVRKLSQLKKDLQRCSKQGKKWQQKEILQALQHLRGEDFIHLWNTKGEAQLRLQDCI